MNIFRMSNSQCQITFLKDSTNFPPKPYGYSSLTATSPALGIIILGIFKSITNPKLFLCIYCKIPIPSSQKRIHSSCSHRSPSAQSNPVLYHLVDVFLFIQTKLTLNTSSEAFFLQPFNCLWYFFLDPIQIFSMLKFEDQNWYQFSENGLMEAIIL